MSVSDSASSYIAIRNTLSKDSLRVIFCISSEPKNRFYYLHPHKHEFASITGFNLNFIRPDRNDLAKTKELFLEYSLQNPNSGEWRDFWLDLLAWEIGYKYGIAGAGKEIKESVSLTGSKLAYALVSPELYLPDQWKANSVWLDCILGLTELRAVLPLKGNTAVIIFADPLIFLNWSRPFQNVNQFFHCYCKYNDACTFGY